MALFGFGKKKKADPAQVCTCGCSCSAGQPEEKPSTGNTPCHQGGHTIKVLGTGCNACHTLLEHTQSAVSQLGLRVDVEYVQDMAQIAGYGVMSVPALVVDDAVVSTGKVLKPSEVEAILRQRLQ